MKTFSKKLDGTGTEPQQITEHEVTAASKKISGYLLHLATLAAVLASFFMTGCEPEPEYSGSYPTPVFHAPPPMVINNMFPSAGAPGSIVAILGENFDTSTSDNYVTFGSSYAEILHVTYGVLNVRVPMDIPEGDYKISVSSNGQSADAPHVFSVIKDTK
ncbi:MAG TPA: IPT/TIG domain-containing protein [Saprospiraceae bacterium]|nr:IPT/TIG domain-containing protein [Saprospiraceae bacterium]